MLPDFLAVKANRFSRLLRRRGFFVFGDIFAYRLHLYLRMPAVVLIYPDTVMVDIVAVGNLEGRFNIVGGVNTDHRIFIEVCDGNVDRRGIGDLDNGIFRDHNVIGKGCTDVHIKRRLNYDHDNYDCQRYEEAEKPLHELGRKHPEINKHLRQTENGCHKGYGEVLDGKPERTDIIGGEYIKDGGQNNQTEPVLLIDEPADKRHRNGRQRPHKPVGIIPEQLPAHILERHFKEINQRLADEEEYKDLGCADQRLPDFFKEAAVFGVVLSIAVCHNDDCEEEPRLKRDTHSLKGSILENRYNQKYRCHHSGSDREQNDVPPAHVQSAVGFFNEADKGIFVLRCSVFHNDNQPLLFFLLYRIK